MSAQPPLPAPADPVLCALGGQDTQSQLVAVISVTDSQEAILSVFPSYPFSHCFFCPGL